MSGSEQSVSLMYSQTSVYQFTLTDQLNNIIKPIMSSMQSSRK